MALNTESVRQSKVGDIFGFVDLCTNIIFTIEMCMRIVWMGFFMGEVLTACLFEKTHLGNVSVVRMHTFKIPGSNWTSSLWYSVGCPSLMDFRTLSLSVVSVLFVPSKE